MSDSRSCSSDEGIRYKTDTTRYKTNEYQATDTRRYKMNEYQKTDRYSKYNRSTEKRDKRSRKSRSRSRSPRRDKYYKKNRKDSEYSPTHSSSSKSDKKIKNRLLDADIKSSSKQVFGPTRPSNEKSESYNPVLPTSSASSSRKTDHIIIGAEPPPQCYNEAKVKETHNIGPQLPQRLKEISKESTSETASYGPALPPSFKSRSVNQDLNEHLQNTDNNDKNDKVNQLRILGPRLPSDINIIKSEIGELDGTGTESRLSPINTNKEESFSENRNSSIGRSSDEEDNDCYGPLPPGMASNSQAHAALEERALQMKIDKLSQSDADQITREEWMIELPAVHAKNFGLGPRQFRPNAGPDFSDRTSWTDTPQDKAKKLDKSSKKVDVKKEAEIREQKRYDDEQEKIIKKHKKDKREKSLVEIHQDNLNKKKKDDGPSVRRPFSRDIDLQVNHFDEAQKKAILKKAQLLDDRFSKGQSKFL